MIRSGDGSLRHSSRYPSRLISLCGALHAQQERAKTTKGERTPIDDVSLLVLGVNPPTHELMVSKDTLEQTQKSCVHQHTLTIGQESESG